MRITIHNANQRIVTTLRSLAGARTDISVSYDMVLAGAPDVIEYGPIDFRVDRANISPTTVSLELVFHSGFLNAAFPAGQFSPSNAA